MNATVAVAGASGLIGQAVVAALRSRGDDVVTLVRRPARGPAERSWDPAREQIDSAALDGVDAVVNLAGAGIGDKRWSTAHKADILQSRVNATRTLAEAIAASGRPIRLVNGSAVGFYGDRGEEALTEANPPGLGFLSEVVRAWETAAESAVTAGAPVAYARTGIVLSAAGGALAKLLPLARFGLVGPLGSGRQYWPIISRADEVAALIFLVDHAELTGPVDVVGLEPVRQRDVMRALGSALHRPAVLPAPRLALRLIVGEFAGDLVSSQRVLPERLLDAGFTHVHRTTAAVVAAALADRSMIPPTASP